MQKDTINFNKEKTLIVKGFAIFFMILLHVFGGSGWYDKDLPMNHNENLISFMHSFQICVGIFVFLIGFGYSFSKNKDLHYSIKHIKNLLTVFWIILFAFAIPAGYNAITGGGLILLNMFGLDQTLLWVSWFVYLYIWAMLIMPFCGRLLDLKPYLSLILLSLVSFVSQVVIWYFVRDFNSRIGWHSLFVCFSWTPTILLGYVFAKKNLFQKVRLPHHWSIPVICLVIIFVTIYLKKVIPGIKILNFDIIYAPLIILCILTIFSQYNLSIMRKVFIELGDKSVYMWFIHALFFSASTRPFYHKFVMISDNLWIIALWTIILSYCISVPMKKVIEL